jgi:hypothetical protein
MRTSSATPVTEGRADMGNVGGVGGEQVPASILCLRFVTWSAFLFSRGVPAAAAAAAAAAALLVDGVILGLLLLEEKVPLTRDGRFAPFVVTIASASSRGMNLRSRL